ncbi:MAG: CHAT domain-containing protein [Microcoleus sp.]
MDENRAQAYTNLIQQLLSCPNGEEPQILNANLELLDLRFLEACEAVAANFAEQGEENGANFLRSLASQVGEMLGLTSSDGNDVKGNSPDDYVEFLELLLLTEEQNLGEDSQPIYAVLQANIDKLNLNFIPVIKQTMTEFLGIIAPKQAERFASYIENIAIRIKKYPRGSRAENLEISIAAYEIVLSVRNFEINPEGWAKTQNHLGNAYLNRIRGERADNIESAIKSYTAALKAYIRDALPQDWAMTQNHLGNAYYSRIKEERADNIESAIASYTAALEVYTRDAFPEQWAGTQNNLGVAYSKRIKGDRADNIERAIAFYTEALEVRTHDALPQDWADTQNNRAIAYKNRIRGDRADNIERAITFYTEALEVRTRDALPQDWAMTQNNLGSAYYSRIKEERAENIERAIASYTAALEVYTRDAFPKNWAMTQNNLANAYRVRIEGDRVHNTEVAIAYFTAALQVHTRAAFPEQWAMTQNNLANAYSDKITGNRAENIDTAIACYQQALAVYTREDFPENWATTQNNLGEAYNDKITGNRAENIDRAIAFYTAALTVRTREAFPQNHAETLFNLGLAYREVPDLQRAYNTLAAAIETVEFLRGEIHSGDESKQKLAEEWNKLYRNMVEVCLKLKNYTEAIEYAERSKARNLVELLATRDLYPKGDIPETVINELSRLRREIDAEQRRLDNQQTNRNSNGGTTSGERSLQIDRLQTTSRDSTNLTQLRQQLDELLVRDIQPIDPDFLLTQEVKGILYSDIQALTAENTAILQWYILGDKFLTFIITPQSPTPIVWQSSKADFQALVNWRDEYLRDYQQEDKTQWRENLAPRLQSLSEILHLKEILERVSKHCDKLILIPHRYLHLFPLHALPVSREIWQRFNPETQSPEPTNPCILDCFKQGVRYGPSCQLLQQAQRQKRPNFTHLFAVQNPTNDLQFTDLEVPAISQHFHPKDILIKSDAKKSVIDDSRLRIAHCAHFSCHGYFNFQQPLLSALLLADSELPPPPPEENPTRYLPLRNGKTLDLTKCLTLADIFALDFRECRLVVLSACETGISDFGSISDEYISLSSGFLVAGSSSVIPTLWAVNDLSTSFLMIKFYQLLKAGLSVSLALNSAQLWLRDATKEDLQVWTKQLPLHRVEKTTLYDMLKKISSKEIRPFQSPYHWAAFCSVGQ